MTDLERAAEVVDAMGREIGADRVFWPETWRRKILDALATVRLEGMARAAEKAYANGFRRGAAEMRERAAKIADEMAAHYEKRSRYTPVELDIGAVTGCEAVADAIRVLPLTPEGEA